MYPRRPGAEPCLYYLKTGKCNYARRCKFDHPPRDEGLITALNRRDCFDFVQSGSCPYGSRCKYNHPERNTFEFGHPQSRVTCIRAQTLLVPSLRSPPIRDSESIDIINASPCNSDIATSELLRLRSESNSIRPSSLEDPISMLQEGVRPFEWTSTKLMRGANSNHKSSQGFNPLNYDTQLFGSRLYWAPGSPF